MRNGPGIPAVVRSLVANGYGYSILNILPLNNLSPDGKALRIIPLTGDVRPMNLGLVMVEGATNSLTVQAFVDHCPGTS